MDIFEAYADERQSWNEFVAVNFQPVGAFLQSWEWGEFKKRLGTEITRFVVKDGEQWLSVAAFENHKAPLAVDYQYSPRGPVFDRNIIGAGEIISAITRHYERRLKNVFPGSAFARLEPPLEEEQEVFFKKPFYLPR